MTPLRPYLLRAVHEWALDNGYTPHILVDAAVEGVIVPNGYVRDGRITLNIHPQAVHQLDLGNDRVSFFARFGGQSLGVDIPIHAVLAVFARENGRGVFFQDEPGETPPDGTPPDNTPSPKKGPQLKLVK
jgi:stringent starvation protein B